MYTVRMHPGTIVPTLSSEDYHAHPALSRSALWTFKRLPYKYWYEYLSGQFQSKPETDALRLGSLAHTMILEPDLFDSRYLVIEKLNRATKGGKEAYKEALNAAVHRQLIYQDEFEVADAMRKSVYANDVVKDILADASMEYSIFWRDEMTGLEVKARPDIFANRLNIMADVKTTLDASPRSFQLDCFKNGYFLQAAMMYEAALAIGSPIEKFVFICVEKKAPYSLALYVLDDESLAFGQQMLRKILDDYKICKDNNNWPDYGIQTLTVPKYANAMEQNYEQSE